MTVADQNENLIPVVAQPPSKLAQILHVAKLLGIGLVAVSGTILGLASSGTITLPASVTGILTAIAGIGASLGIASGGIKKPDPDALK